MSFLKGFLSLFDWMFPPKTYQELSDDLDNKMQDLYNEMGWGKYNNPLNGYQNAVDCNRVLQAKNEFANEIEVYKNMKNSVSTNASIKTLDNNITITTSKEFLDEMLRLVPSGEFVPYAYYNEDMDAIEVYFKDNIYYSQPLNKSMNLYLDQETNEVVGVNILNVTKLLNANHEQVN